MTWLFTAWRYRKLIAIASVILACVGFSIWLMSVVSERDRLRDELAAEKIKLAAKQIEVDQLQESLAVYRVYREQQLEQDRQFEQLVRNLEAIEGSNAILSPFLRDASERLFGP